MKYILFKKGMSLIMFSFFIFLLVLPANGATPKIKRMDKLDKLIKFSPELKTYEMPKMPSELNLDQKQLYEIEGLLKNLGLNWSLMVDAATGRPSIIQGGAIPFIPGPANDLTWDEVFPGCDSVKCLSLGIVEEKAKEWLLSYSDIFKLDGYEIKADPNGSGPIGDNLYFIRFQPYYEDIPLEGASIYFRINNGNLIQVGCEKFGDVTISSEPQLI